MSSDAPADGASAPITIAIKGPSEIKLSLDVTLDMTVRQLKEAIQEKRQDVTADSQRLIYSGKVLKDDETLATYKLQNNHTVHMVRSASRSAPTTGNPSTGAAPAAQAPPTSSAASSAAQGVPANFGAGQQFTNNPLSALNRADFAGPHMANIGHQMFEGTGMNPNDPNFMMNAMQSPEFRNHMRTMLSRPEFVDQMMALNPQLAQMPGAREMLQSDFFREMLLDPQAMQRAAQFGAAMRGGGGAGGAAPGMGGLGSLFGGAGGGGGAGAAPQWPPPGAFGTPAPGNNDGNAATGGTANTTTGAGAGGAPPNPFAALAGLGGAGGGGAGGMGGIPGLDPAALQQLQQMFGGAGAGGAAGGDPFAALRALGGGAGAGAGLGAGAAANDARPPEERFASQLEQMEGMGLDRAASLQALVLTGGSVERAMALIFDGNLSNFS